MGEHLLARVFAIVAPLLFVACGAAMLLFLASISA